MSAKRRKYVFGPVPSRRLGRSLGVDLVPYKVCSFDCVYCQVAPTTLKTTRRRAYVPAEEVLAELREVLAAGVECDYVTLSGSGEPTLHSELGRIIAAIKAMTDIPVAVLTNGSLLGDPAVRAALAGADLVAPSLDAGDAETFAGINRPCDQIDFDSYVDGLRTFCREFSGMVHLEVFLAAGINDSEGHVRRIRSIIDDIEPDRVDVNTVARPPAEGKVQAITPEKLQRLCGILGPTARVIAAPPRAADDRGQPKHDQVLAMLRRRACTVDDLAAGLKCGRNELAKLLGQLIREGLITTTEQAGRTFYQSSQ